MVRNALRDPYTDDVFASVPLEIRQSFTPEQRVAIREAVAGRERVRRVDVRFVLPLYFTQVYVVFMCGKDRRRDVAMTIHDRRRAAKDYGLLGAMLIAAAILIVAALIVLYYVKSYSGIDLLKDKHVKDVLRELGIATIGAFVALPPAGLGLRFGPVARSR